jgi:hypothetical protein
MVKIIALLLTLVPAFAFADTGLFYDPERDGEGFSITENGDSLSFLYFTYGKDPIDERPKPPTVSPPAPPLPRPNADAPSWFLGANSVSLLDGLWRGELLYFIYDPELADRIAAPVQVGTFEIMRDVESGGYVLDIRWIENIYFGPTAPLYETSYFVRRLAD